VRERATIGRVSAQDGHARPADAEALPAEPNQSYGFTNQYGRKEKANEPSRTAERTARSTAETLRTSRTVVTGSPQGRRPNEALHRIAALLRFLLNLNGSIWAARDEGSR
jgi:hypothetical protein